jgi:hypothetical protein
LDDLTDAAPVVRSFALGLAYTAAALWGDSAFRGRAVPILERVASMADTSIADAVMAVFRRTQPLPVDEPTRELLRIIAASPVLVTASHGFLPDRLKELLRDGLEPELVHSVVAGMMAASDDALGDVRTAWAASAGDFIEIAITLHRSEHTRTLGIELFERLMEVGAYGMDSALRLLDRRAIS